MTSGITVFEQFVRFGTDAYGIERLLRLLQALTTILLHFPTLSYLFLVFLAPFSSPPAIFKTSPTTISSSTTTLTLLRKRIASLRQAVRFFRFLDSFAAAWSVLSSLQEQPQAQAQSQPRARHDENEKEGRQGGPTKRTPATPGPAAGVGGGGGVVVVEKWLDFGSKSFTGMYLLLESAVFVEAVLDVPGLRVWDSPEAVARLVLDGQRFWFAGLVCGILASAVRLARSAGGARPGTGQLGGGKDRDSKDGGEENDEEEEEEEEEVREERKAARRKVVRRLAADIMDLAVPGSVVGWVPLAPGYVAVLMLGSTILTGMEVWERCGRELAAQRAATVARP
ncbi:uncharacterized protein P884DRAFT_285968 [Thermothelomyces heterothallicus CBS 202.75]|uniref:uncharacterized protein n=1 Tax=Thermothelomyces heterothallicus CBS 202.75 TaxID=1149848 RepID=UPI0037429FFB